MNRQEPFDPSVADAKEFQAPQAITGAKAFLCRPIPPQPLPRPQPCRPPCIPCVGPGRSK